MSFMVLLLVMVLLPLPLIVALVSQSLRCQCHIYRDFVLHAYSLSINSGLLKSSCFFVQSYRMADFFSISATNNKSAILEGCKL